MIVDSGRYYLYRHIRLDKNEPFYIGIGSKSYARRLDGYDRAFCKTRTNYWKNIINKTNYEVEILLESDDIEFIIKKEIEFITLYGRKDLKEGNLVNLTNGGEGTYGRKYKYNQESIEKMRKSLIGRKLSVEHCKNISKRMKGRVSPMKGKHQTQKCIDAVRKANTGKVVTSETGEKIRQSKIGKPVPESTYSWRYKKIDQFSKEDLFIKTWENARDVAKYYNVGASEISITCKANRGDYPKEHKSFNRKTCRGFIWKYKQN